MDQQTSQKKVSNRLQEVNNPITGPDNYPLQNEFEYDDLGNLSAESDGSLSMEWTNSGKLKKVTKPGVYEITFTYDAMGNRVTKNRHDIPTGNNNLTYYVRDAQGNNMATYETRESNSSNTIQYILKELYLYGSNRLGYINLGLAIQNPTSPFSELPAPGSQFFSVSGFKNYELTNHLGNVLSVVSDDAPTSQQADLVCSNDYFPFGSQMLERAFSSGGYRFGFNTQERTDEIAGLGNHNTALFWEYDTRLGRRWNLDKVKKSWQSSYCSFSNNPIIFVDPKGDDDYYNKAGKWIGSDGVGTDIRIANNITTKEQFDYFKAQGADGIEVLKSPEQSTLVTIVDNQQSALKNMFLKSEKEKGAEVTAYIVLDIEKAILTIEEQPIIKTPDPKHSSRNEYDEAIDNDFSKQRGGNFISVKGSNANKVIVGQIHIHPENGGEIVTPGVSVEGGKNVPKGESDVTAADVMGVPVYAVDKNYIHKVDQKSEIKNMQSHSTKIIVDALETSGEKDK